MNKAPVFILDDDREELEIVQEIWGDLNFDNPLEVFTSPQDLISRLSNGHTNPFLILSDVHLPEMDGFALREKLAKNNNSKYKSIPFIFWSTTASNEQIKKAYDSGGHGFFFKGGTYQEIKDSLNIIMIYWNASKSPTIGKA